MEKRERHRRPGGQIEGSVHVTHDSYRLPVDVLHPLFDDVYIQSSKRETHIVVFSFFLLVLSIVEDRVPEFVS